MTKMNKLRAKNKTKRQNFFKYF